MSRRTGIGPGLAIRRKRQTGHGSLPSIDLRRAEATMTSSPRTAGQPERYAMTDNPSPPDPGKTPPEPPAPTPGWPAAPPSVPPASLLRRYRGRLISGIAGALVVLAVSVFLSSHSAGPRGSISLPARLLGLPRYTGLEARSFDARLAKKIMTGPNGRYLVHVVAAAYGDLLGSGPLLAVVGGGECGTCAAKPAGPLVRFLVTRGFADARTFPPGPAGGWLVCLSQAGGQFGKVFSCAWGDSKTSGEVDYLNGSAAGLADAAAKTRRILAAVER